MDMLYIAFEQCAVTAIDGVVGLLACGTEDIWHFTFAFFVLLLQLWNRTMYRGIRR